MTTAHALQTPSTPRNFCSMDAAPILATMPQPVPVKPRTPQQARVMDLFGEDKSLSGKLTGRTHADRLRQYEGIAPRANVGVSAGGYVNRAHFAAAAGTIRRPASQWSSAHYPQRSETKTSWQLQSRLIHSPMLSVERHSSGLLERRQLRLFRTMRMGA